MTKRRVSLPDDAEDAAAEFVDDVDRRLSSGEDLSEVVTGVLAELNGDRNLYERQRAGEDVTPAERARLDSYDPRNATLESEYYAELVVQEEEWARSKPLQWLWRQFDDTPVANNVDVGLRFRNMLGKHLFAECGDDCRFFGGITMTYGHNIEVGDNVVVHNDVHLDDRGHLSIGDRVSISDGAHVYTHSHDVVDQTEVTNFRTVVEDDVRLTFDSMVQAGCKIGRNALVGARAIVQADVPEHHVAVGMPAKSVSVKPGWEDVAEPLEDAQRDRREGRVIEYDLAGADFEPFDEFRRDLQPPGG